MMFGRILLQNGEFSGVEVIFSPFVLLPFQIGRNNFSSKGATALLEYIKGCPDMVLNYVDFAVSHILCTYSRTSMTRTQMAR